MAVDVHAHIASGDALAEMRDVHAPVVPIVDSEGDMVFFRYPNGTVNGPVPIGIVDVDARLRDMAATGVDHQVLSTRPQLFTYDLDAEVAAALAGLANDSMVRTARAHPDAFSVMISLPMQSADHALREIERHASNRSVRGVLVDSNISGRDFADAAFLPVWEALERENLAVLVHPYQADVVGKDRLTRHYLFNLIGNPVDTTIAIGNVVFGGLVDRFPNLRWGFVHGGGVAPYLAGRWDHGWSKREVTRQHIPETLPSDVLSRFWFDCLVHRPEALAFLGDLVGWDRIMLGSDYPFDMGLRDPVGFVDTLALPTDEREAVMSHNAERFLRPR